MINEMKRQHTYPFQPAREDIAKLANRIWMLHGGGETTTEVAVENWLEAESILRRTHCG